MSAADDARRIVSAWQAGGVEAVVPLVHPEFVGEVGPQTSVEPDTYVGEAGVRRYFALWDEAMRDLKLDLVAAEDAAPGVAVVHLGISGTGIESGVRVALEAWTVMRFRDGQLGSMASFGDRETALSVAGNPRG